MRFWKRSSTPSQQTGQAPEEEPEGNVFIQPAPPAREKVQSETAVAESVQAAAEGDGEKVRDEHAKVREPQSIDWILFVLMIMILGMGLIMVLSSSGIKASADHGNKYFFFMRQLIFAGAGGLAMTSAALVSRQLLYRMHYVMLFLALFLLLLTLSPLTPEINGAHRWIRLGPVNVQPMEFAKIALAMYFAYYVSEKQQLIKTFTRGFFPPLAVTVLFCMLLLMQPDFGGAAMLATLMFAMFFVAGVRFIYLIGSIGVIVLAGALLVINAPYRLRRLLAFRDPFADAMDTGYQLVQSLLAIGSGSFFGVGIGASRQKMSYLPEAHNDFIMAVLAEEMGFIGVSVVFLLFALFFWRCYLIIMGQRELRDRFTAFAMTVILATGVILNLAVVMGVAPPKGVPMPLMSYGGSNLVCSMITIGVLLNLSRTSDYTQGGCAVPPGETVEQLGNTRLNKKLTKTDKGGDGQTGAVLTS